jgi:hypothetical protein
MKLPRRRFLHLAAGSAMPLGQAIHLVKRYGLAVCCVVGPLFFASIALNEQAKLLIPLGIENIIIVPDKRMPPRQNATSPSASTPSSSPPKPELDSTLFIQSQYIAGSFNWAVMNAFVYVLSPVLLIVAAITIVQRFGLNLSIAVVLAGAFVALAFDSNILINSPPNVIIQVFFNLFDGIDKFDGLTKIVSATGTAKAMSFLNAVDEFISLLLCAMVAFGMAALSIRASEAELNVGHLKARRNTIHLLIMCTSVALSMAVISTKLLFAWPLGLIAQSQAVPLQTIADTVTVFNGALGTIVFISALGPAAVAWLLDVSAFRRRRERAEPNNSASLGQPVDDGLTFAPISLMTGLAGLVAPIIASPFIDALKHFLTFSQN